MVQCAHVFSLHSLNRHSLNLHEVLMLGEVLGNSGKQKKNLYPQGVYGALGNPAQLPVP